VSEPAVVARQVSKRFGALRAVDGLDLVIEQGAIFGLVGPNGAGKSTTFGILCGWLAPTSGEAQVLGTPCRRLHTLRGRVAALPQDAAFPPQIAVVDQLAHWARLGGLGARAALTEAERVLERVGLRELARQRGGTLSHGQRKRVGLAQALLGEPEVLFLDEPTAGLDPAARRAVHEIVAGLGAETTIVVSSHDLAEVQELCTHGAILDRGRSVAVGSMSALRGEGNEVAIEIRPGASVPWDALRVRFGATAVSLLEDPSGRATGRCAIRVQCAADVDIADAIGAALQMLLEGGVPILGVERGRSLESRFLEVTAPGQGAGADGRGVLPRSELSSAESSTRMSRSR